MPEKIFNILVVDDEESMRELLDVMLSKEGYQITTAESGRKAISLLGKKDYDLLLCDIRLGDMTGIDVLRELKKKSQHTVVIMISAYASTETAVEAMNEGAYDYVPKPFDNNELKQTIANALALKTIEQEKILIDDELKKQLHFGKIIGNSSAMLHVYNMIKQVARTKTSILITGESGTGKEIIARAIHDESDRSDKPFVPINCGGIPETLMESELFGYKKGAFTGANQDKKGLFEIADEGTIFLDEIGDLSIHLQVKLLRVLQERVFKPVGGNEDKTVNIRIISATNKDLANEVIEGRFREDLFYRINVIEIKLPPLRERKEDLRALAQHFLEKYSNDMGKKVTKISSYALNLLYNYSFPGNIRELENLMERSVAISDTNILLPDSLSLSLHKRKVLVDGIKGKYFDVNDVSKGVSLDSILEEVERAYVNKAMEYAGGEKSKAAELLGINMRSLKYRLDKLGTGN
jgi:two-component system, NtrC family, response regulator PilR